MRFVTQKTTGGPQTSSVTEEEARKQLVAHPEFPSEADPESVKLTEENGQWVASFRVAAPFPPGDQGPDGPPSPPSGEDQSDFTNGEDKPTDDSEDDSEDKPKEDKKDSEKSELKELTDLVHQIAEAVGVPVDGPDDSPVPSPDGPGPEGLPDGPPPPDDNKTQHIQHDRALKPGEAPPGTVPIGAPSFSNVQKENPFPEFIGKVATFKVEDESSEQTIKEATAEINKLVKPHGYKVIKALYKNPTQRPRGIEIAVSNRSLS